MPTCSIADCDGGVRARGWCSSHYSRWQRNGDVDASTPLRLEHATPSRHGTLGKYTQGCKCDPCFLAAREYRSTLKEQGLAEDDPRHGTSSGYSAFQCRCDECRGWLSGRYRYHRESDVRRRMRKADAKSEPYTRESIAERDGHRCQLCNGTVDMERTYPDPQSPSIDHILPLSHGGDDTRANVQLSHLGCNWSKGNRGTDQLRLVG